MGHQSLVTSALQWSLSVTSGSRWTLSGTPGSFIHAFRHRLSFQWNDELMLYNSTVALESAKGLSALRCISEQGGVMFGRCRDGIRQRNFWAQLHPSTVRRRPSRSIPAGFHAHAAACQSGFRVSFSLKTILGPYIFCVFWHLLF